MAVVAAAAIVTAQAAVVAAAAIVTVRVVVVVAAVGIAMVQVVAGIGMAVVVEGAVGRGHDRVRGEALRCDNNPHRPCWKWWENHREMKREARYRGWGPQRATANWVAKSQWRYENFPTQAGFDYAI
jgi:hypothetical protein